MDNARVVGTGGHARLVVDFDVEAAGVGAGHHLRLDAVGADDDHALARFGDVLDHRHAPLGEALGDLRVVHDLTEVVDALPRLGGGLRQLDLDLVLTQAVVYFLHLEVNDLLHLINRERREHDDLINKIEELRPERSLERLLNLVMRLAFLVVVLCLQEY